MCPLNPLRVLGISIGVRIVGVVLRGEERSVGGPEMLSVLHHFRLKGVNTV